MKQEPSCGTALCRRTSRRLKNEKEDCGQCPIKSSCIRSDRRTPAFLPQQLYERQAAVRATRQTRPWQANYAMRALHPGSAIPPGRS